MRALTLTLAPIAKISVSVVYSQTNSQFFSAIAPARALSYPDITVEMPVYREGLEAVILPSIVSLEVTKFSLEVTKFIVQSWSFDKRSRECTWCVLRL